MQTRSVIPVKRLWLRNGLFLALCVLGLGAVAGNLLSHNRIEPPRSRDAAVIHQPDFQRTLAKVDQEFRDAWQKTGLQPTPPADHLALARRLALGLAGTVPSVEEIRALEAQPEEERLAWFVSHLLEDRRSADYLAERLARAYVGTENGPFLVYRRRRFVIWLSDRLYENTPYDQIVRHLIADTGLWTSSPAVNFVTVTLDSNNDNQPDGARLAARTTRAFLGMRIDCLQCHDDMQEKFAFGPERRPGEQRDFHQLAAFFSEVRQTPTGIRDTPGKPYRFQYLYDTEATTVRPTTPFAAEHLSRDGSRRQQLARWVTHRENRMFARATVNRIWALVTGRPLVEPIDDLPLEGEYPPGLETLADDFARHGYNLRRLVRLIVASEAFQRDSQADFQITEAHETHWAAFPLSRLRPEQVAGGLIQAASLTTIDADAHIVWQLAKFGQTNDFVRRYGDTGDDEFTDRGGTITQRLLLMNGELVKERTKDDLVANAATRLAHLARNEAAVETAYLAVLTRRPTEEERSTFGELLQKTSPGQSRAHALEDLYWVLLNSTEFSWNH